MWTFTEVVELAVLITAAGTALGLSLRAYDEWAEKRTTRLVEAVKSGSLLDGLIANKKR